MDVRILGSLEASDDGRVIDLGLRQARLVFAALALQAGSPVRSARLAEILWPGGPPSRWEATVQSHVSRLRKALEPDRPPRAPSARLSTRGDSYVLHLSPDELDAGRFDRLAAEGRAALAREEHARADELLGRALDEWRGPVLADLPDPAFLGPEADRLEELRLLTTEERAEAALALGDHRRVVADLEPIVANHPLRERCWELLLLALYRSGRQADALRRYQEVRGLLVGDLGIEPGPALRALENAILRQEETLGPPPSVRATATETPVELPLPAWLQAPRDVFVGRDRELDAMRASFQRALQGKRRLTLIAGEPGIGKTRLVREACRELHDGGALVLGGRCIEEPLHVLQPFAEALDRFAVAQSERLAQEAPSEVSVLADLVPDLSLRAAALPEVDAEAHRYLLFRAVGSLLDAHRVGRPIVLVLDDLQWAAHASIQLLSHLLHDDDRGPLLVVATARDTEPTEELNGLMADLRRDRRLDRLAVQGLSPDEVSELATARGSDTAASEVYAMTEGNPFYVEELVRHVTESGGTLEPGAIPDSVRDTIARRLLRLPEEVRRVLGIAGVAGGEFRLDVVARAAEIGIEAADDAIAAAARAGILVEQPGRAGSYGFSHALIQATLREGLGAARRARVHRRFGEALATLGGAESEIARHLLAAAADGSDVGPGVEAALTAARSAFSRHGYDDAAAVLRSAWRALAERASADAELRCRVGLAFCAALRRGGSYEERAPVLEETWALAAGLPDRELMGWVVDEGCSGWVVPAEPWPSRAEQVSALLDEESDRRIVLTSILARVRSQQPGESARQLAEWALARASGLGAYERRNVIDYCISALAAWSPIERIVDLARANLDAARETGDPVEMVQGLSMVRRVHLAAGDLAASDAVGGEYEELVRAVRIPRFLAGVEQRRAMRALLAGRFVEAEAHAGETIALQPTPEFMEGYAVQIFALRFEQGRLDEVRDTVESWAARDERAAWQIGLAALLAESGETDAAANTMEPFVRAGFENVPRDDPYFLSLGVAAAVVDHIGDREAAGVLYELLSPHASRVIVAGDGALCWGSFHRFLGPLGALLGHTERASMHFEAAMSVHERLGARPFLARDRLAYAALLRDTGADPVRIENLTRTGLALASRLGMRGVVARYPEPPAP